MENVVTWSAVAVSIATMLSLLGFWTRYSDRVTKAEGAAAAANDLADMAKREAHEANERFNALQLDSAHRIAALHGEGMKLRADAARETSELAAKLYQVEIWARDEFVRKGSFEQVVTRMERGFDSLRNEIAGRLDKMTDRIEHLGHAS